MSDDRHLLDQCSKLESKESKFQAITIWSNTGSPIPDDLIGVIVNYTTTLVTFELVTMSGGNWRETYTNVLWKRKLQYEAKGLLVDLSVINSNSGESENTWFRYYLAKNRTIWGSVLHTFGKDDEIKATPVSLPGPVIATGFLRQAPSSTKLFLIFQLADLRLAVKTGPRKRDVQIIGFSERIREFIVLNLADEVAFLTERGGVYYIVRKEIGEVFLAPLTGNGPGGVVGLARLPEGKLLGFHRDGTLSIYNWTVWRPICFAPKGGLGIVQLVDFYSEISVLLVDGTVGPIENRGESSVVTHDTSGEICYEIGLDKFSGTVSGNAPETWGMVSRRNIAVRTYDFHDYQGLYQLGDRTTVSYRGESAEVITLPTDYRTQFITGCERHGLIILDLAIGHSPSLPPKDFRTR